MTESTRPDKLQRLVELLRELPIRTPSDVSDGWPEHELTMTQFKALTYLQSGPQRMGDISRYLNVSLSSGTSLVSRLESKGLVRRTHDTDDRRVVTCELTSEGEETITRLWQVGREGLIHVASHLSVGELDQIIRAFEILVNASSRIQSPGDDH